jgi:putative selenate reductase FAD-binding subunit
MIVEYHRPGTLDEALRLLGRPDILTVPLGGGTVLSQKKEPDFAVVDLQELGLEIIDHDGDILTIGAMVRLQNLYELPNIPGTLNEAIKREMNINQRQTATIAGTLVSGNGRSPMAAALMALDAHLVWMPGLKEIALGDWLPVRKEPRYGIITSIKVALKARLGLEIISRSPDDQAIVCVAIGMWPSGRTRVV